MLSATTRRERAPATIALRQLYKSEQLGNGVSGRNMDVPPCVKTPRQQLRLPQLWVPRSVPAWPGPEKSTPSPSGISPSAICIIAPIRQNLSPDDSAQMERDVCSRNAQGTRLMRTTQLMQRRQADIRILTPDYPYTSNDLLGASQDLDHSRLRKRWKAAQ